MRRVLGFATVCLLSFTALPRAAKADFVPLPHEQNMALVAEFMTGSFSAMTNLSLVHNLGG